MQKLLLMQSQLNLDNKRYELEVTDRREAKEERKAERDALKEERAQDRADRLAEIREQRAERDREREERREIWQAQEKERKERIKLMTTLYGEGRSPSEIQQMLQMGFGS
jgi:transposase